MREISCDDITAAVAGAVIKANTELPDDIYQALQQARQEEEAEIGRRCLEILLENARLARQEGLALCQDTGQVVVNVELGQDVHITGGSLVAAINEGIARGYREGFFRASVVENPLFRRNTGDNTPGIINTVLLPGDGFRLTVFPKGAGSENMGRIAMLKPADGLAGVEEFILGTVEAAGGNPCPPVIVGVGLGGNMEKAALLAKQALQRPVNQRHPDSSMAELEKKLLARVNRLGIGPQGLGGRITALAVNIEYFPTHIASLPVAVNLGCHCTRRCTVEL